MISLEKLENKWGKLEKLELEILEMSPNRTLENKAGSSPDGKGSENDIQTILYPSAPKRLIVK